MGTRIGGLAVALLLLAGCDNVRLEPRFKMVPRFGEAPPAAPKDPLEQLQRDLDAQLKQLDQEVQRLQQSAAGKGDEAKAEADHQAKLLETRKNDLQRQLDQAGKAGEEALRKIGAAIDQAVKDAQAGAPPR